MRVIYLGEGEESIKKELRENNVCFQNRKEKADFINDCFTNNARKLVKQRDILKDRRKERQR